MSEQEKLWESGFGDAYNSRNIGMEKINFDFFLKSLVPSGVDPDTILELGCGTGMNLAALHSLYPGATLYGVEVNKDAAERVEHGMVFNEAISTFSALPDGSMDLVLTKGLLIHINPDDLPTVYEKIYDLSKKYILLCEYYNPTPVTVPYRGQDNALFKRDFAGEMIDLYNLKLVDYGFVYHKDKFPQDDITWFLLEKK